MRTLARGSLGVCQGQGARTYLAKDHLSPHRASAQADVARTSGKKDNLVGVVITPTKHMPTNGRRHGTQLESQLFLMGCHQPTSRNREGHMG